ncbi:uncharacterized protein IL334_004789 [Kwoniella shivajii]|uniref:Uncharacterized protein n=1 Tax=Kwoniella shivajii TaxID=564305 RepID=A0ABZ1D1P3_9TREE|nr:hypothetical protein IL334_004789 [Kwoniella shivajii]
MSNPATPDDLDTELELITSSLLPAEKLNAIPSELWPIVRIINITSDDSKLSLYITVSERYKRKVAVHIEVRSSSMGRDEALDWIDWVREKMEEWNEEEDYPLFQILTTHFLPLLAPSSPSPPSSPPRIPTPLNDISSKPHHCLLISHHLLSNTKRKDLISLSSDLSLIGFSKTGHPGIMYAIGSLPDLEEWIREVKSWNWLALRVRVAPELIEEEEGRMNYSRGKENGARRGKGRGEWKELDKINEALDWLKSRGKNRELILVDCGVGGSS